MNTTFDPILEEIWAIKDRLSADCGHDLAATCRAIYAEQAADPERFLVLRRQTKAQEAGAGQPAARPESNSEGSDKPQQKAEGPTH